MSKIYTIWWQSRLIWAQPDMPDILLEINCLTDQGGQIWAKYETNPGLFLIRFHYIFSRRAKILI